MVNCELYDLKVLARKVVQTSNKFTRVIWVTAATVELSPFPFLLCFKVKQNVSRTLFSLTDPLSTIVQQRFDIVMSSSRPFPTPPLGLKLRATWGPPFLLHVGFKHPLTYLIIVERQDAKLPASLTHVT